MARMLTTTLLVAAMAATLFFTLTLAQGHQHGAGNAPGGAAMGPMGMGYGAGAAGSHGMGDMAHATDELSFLVHMIPHHQEAIDSAHLLLAVTERAELQALAASIISVQEAEIAWMEAHLERWYPGADRDAHYQPMMRVLAADASAAAVEQAFLEDMIGHHMMAVHDARNLLAGGWAQREEVADFARTILVDQMTEIMLMRGWLADWFGGTQMGMMGMGHGDAGHGDAGHGHLPTIGAAEARRLAQAFLDGRGGGTAVAAVATSDGYAVVVEGANGTVLLIVDSQTGAVRTAPER